MPSPKHGSKRLLLASTFLALFALVIVAALTSPVRDLWAHAPQRTADESLVVENLRAFAKLYGYVRFFHPSDEASEIDWDRFAIYGARQVRDADDLDDLRSRLERLFGPIAPTVRLNAAEAEDPLPHPLLAPDDTSGLELVAWQHRGVYLGNFVPYRSIRLNRPPLVPDPTFATFIRRVDASAFRRHEVKLRGAVKTGFVDDGGRAYLGLATESHGRDHEVIDDMRDRPITNPEWNVYEIRGEIDEDADEIVFGATVAGSGRVWFDDFRLFVRVQGQDAWMEVVLDDPGFELGSVGEVPPSWTYHVEGYALSTTDAEAYEGDRSLVVESMATSPTARPLFDERPAAGEVVTRTLGRGLHAEIPLALYSRDGRTLLPDEAPPLDELRERLAAIRLDTLTVADEALRHAGIVITWNVLQHFYPFFDLVDADWDDVLPLALARAREDSSHADFVRTLRWMVEFLNDGHANVVSRAGTSDVAGFPFLVDEVEGRSTIVAVAGEREDACFRRGDVIVSIDDLRMEDVRRDLESYVSGSPQWKTSSALRTRFGRGERGSFARIVLERPDETVTCDVVRDFAGLVREERPDPIAELRPGIHYVDLTRTDRETIVERAAELAGAAGVIFDLRGPHNQNVHVLGYLSTDTLYSELMLAPHVIYPDRVDPVGYDTERFVVLPRIPQFSGEVVLLTDARTYSLGESIANMFDHYDLGTIVGQRSAGANGSANPISLPGGYSVWWTGMRVLKHDRSLHHVIGAQPHVPIRRTLDGVRAGRDEILEAALDLLARR